jgi:hypothetical protein
MLGSLVESVAAPVAAASLARKPNWQRAVSSLDRLGQPVAFVDARSPPYQQSEAASAAGEGSVLTAAAATSCRPAICGALLTREDGPEHYLEVLLSAEPAAPVSSRRSPFPPQPEEPEDGKGREDKHKQAADSTPLPATIYTSRWTRGRTEALARRRADLDRRRAKRDSDAAEAGYVVDGAWPPHVGPDRLYGSWLRVGLARKGVLNADRAWCHQSSAFWGIRPSDGRLHHGSCTTEWIGMQPFGVGDRLGLLLDTDAGSLTVYKNGVQLGTAVPDGLEGMDDLCWAAVLGRRGESVRAVVKPKPGPPREGSSAAAAATAAGRRAVRCSRASEHHYGVRYGHSSGLPMLLGGARSPHGRAAVAEGGAEGLGMQVHADGGAAQRARARPARRPARRGMARELPARVAQRLRRGDRRAAEFAEDALRPSAHYMEAVLVESVGLGSGGGGGMVMLGIGRATLVRLRPSARPHLSVWAGACLRNVCSGLTKLRRRLCTAVVEQGDEALAGSWEGAHDSEEFWGIFGVDGQHWHGGAACTWVGMQAFGVGDRMGLLLDCWDGSLTVYRLRRVRTVVIRTTLI